MKVRTITPTEIAGYREHGVSFLPSLIDSETVAKILQESDRRQKSPGPFSSQMAKAGSFFEERMCYRQSDVLREFVLDSGLGAAVAPAMDAHVVRAFFDHLFVCEPNTPVDHYWHQDIAYWPVTGDQICSVWIVLTDCDRDSSALQFVPGSDKGELYGVREFGDGENYGGATQASGGDKIPRYHEDPERYGILCRDLKAGDAYLFNGRVMHSSGGNRSADRPRVAYSTRWIGDDIRWYPHRAFRDDALFIAEDALVEGGPLDDPCFPVVWRGTTN
jgi:ectoine hydroxylase-related dioxygenase (phytanoyl-CoA dioxygenase family)